ncbi:MAG: metallophosphoesterase [Alphaproteobacteria bacterium]|nr:metallophosphoesterase [Alphaproteobacteria bacterium]
MIGEHSRRRFLKTLGAGGALLALPPGLGRAAWAIQGSERGVLRIVFYTDVHARTEWDTPAAMMMAAGAINAQKADLVLCGGDLITDGFDSTSEEVAPRWDAYMAMHKEIGGEQHVAIGNHDLVGVLPKDGSPPAADPRADYKRRLGLTRTYWSFDALGYHVMLLDSMRVSGDEYKYHGWVSAEQIEWIKEELSRIAPGTPIVLVLHVPLVTAFYSATKGTTFQAKPNRVVVNNKEVLALFAEHNLVLVLQGHLHVSELLRWRGTTFITGGAVCAKWWRGPYFGTEEGFNAVTLRGDRVEWEYLTYGWQARRPKKK